MDVKETGEKLLGQDYTKQAKDKSSLGKDDFMKLMLAQMQHQDPLSPQDSTEYLSQLAQMSSLEELQNMNESMKNLSIMQASATNSQMVDYVGKTITASTNEISVSSTGNKAEMEYELESNASSVDITITDENGNVVRTIKAGSKSLGKHKINWDGKDDEGNPVPPGKYTFDIAGVDKNGAKVKAETFIKGTVTGISYENGYPELLIGDVKVPVGNVVSIDDETKEKSFNFSNIKTPEKIELSENKNTYLEKLLTKKASLGNFYNINK